MLIKILSSIFGKKSPRHFIPEDLYKSLIDEVKDYALYTLDVQGNITTWNQGSERLKGYSSKEIIGKHHSIFLVPETRSSRKWEQELHTAIRDGRFEEEMWQVRKDGSCFWANVVILPLFQNRMHCGFAKITKDLTQRRTLEENDRQKNEFLAMLAHELRNPLAPVRTAVHIIKEEYSALLDEKFLQIDSMINRQLNHMSRIIDDLLDVARVTHGKIKLDIQPVRVHKAIEGAFSVLSSQGKVMRHNIRISCPKELTVLADPTRLEQIIINLLSNSLKYTDEGKEISIEAGNQDDGFVHIVVSDCGCGISPSVLPRIFDLFYQSDQSIERTSGGLGLGLTIVKRLMDLHGGSVRVKSDLGVGTIFDVGFQSMVPQKDTAQTTNNRPGCKRILIVEDNKDAAQSLSILFSLDNHDVRICHDGNTAVIIANLFDPDVVILDIGLPGLSGFDVARALRSSTITENVKIVAVSGYSRENDLQQAKLIGIDAYLAKPADPNKLRRMIIDKV